jgi:hypothetical protein
MHNFQMKIVFGCLALVTFIVSCKGKEDPIYDVMYRVKGTSRYHKIVYKDSVGNNVVLDSVRDHWEKGFFGKKGSQLYLEAQNLDTTGNITATISVNGNVKKTITETAPKGVAIAESKAE